MDSCFFKNFSSKACGVSSSFPFGTSVVQLRLCDNDTSHHLKSLNVARGLTEGVLISARAGLFAYDPNILVCPAHRSSLGLRWRRSRLCVFPGHTGKSKPDRSLSLQMCKNIFVQSGTIVPVGGGVCKKCREYYYKHMRITGGGELSEDFQTMIRNRMWMGARRAEQTSHQAILDSVMKETDEGRQPMLSTQHEVAIPVKDVGNSERDRDQLQDLPNTHLSGIHDGINILINSGTSEIDTHNSCEMTSHSGQPNDTSEPTESLVTGEVLCSVKREFFPNANVSENDTHNSVEMTSGNAQTNNTSEPTESLVTGEVICSVKREFFPEANESESDTQNSFEMSLHSGLTNNTYEPTESLVTGEVLCSVKREFFPNANVSGNYTHSSFETTSDNAHTNDTSEPTESLVTEVLCGVKREFFPDTNISENDTHNSFEMTSHSGQTYDNYDLTESLVTEVVLCNVKREFHPGANVSENYTHNSFEMTSHSILTNETYKPKESLVTGEVPQIVKHEFRPDTNVSETDTHNAFEMTSHSSLTYHTSGPTESFFIGKVPCSEPTGSFFTEVPHNVKQESCSSSNVSDTHNYFEMTSNNAQTNSTYESTESYIPCVVKCTNESTESYIPCIVNSILNESHKKMNDQSNILKRNDSSCDLPYGSVVMETSSSCDLPYDSVVMETLSSCDFPYDSLVMEASSSYDSLYDSVVMETSVGSSTDTVTNNRK